MAESKPVLVSNTLVKQYGEQRTDTLHLKNLLSLGEDRYLTTLLLKTFPEKKLKFTPNAKAKTSAPNSWRVLLSQRRRWINSTVHNLFELLLVQEMCGFFVFSMRFIVIFDLLTTILSPAGFVYIIYMVVQLATDDLDGQIPLVSLLMIGAIYGLQVILFVIKREWQHIGWMLLVIQLTSTC
jgi:chitin synthase